MWTRKRVIISVSTAVAVLAPMATAWSSGPGLPSWARGLPGFCTPATAHYANQHVVKQSGGPVACGVSTGWPAVENRIEVSNDGAVIYEPALQGGPVLAGDGHVPGWGHGWSVARTFNSGHSWDAPSVSVFPDDYVLEGQVDNNIYVDHDTNRFFWYQYNSLGTPQVPYGCGGGGGATVVYSDNNGDTWQWGFDRDHDCSENPTLLTAKAPVGGEATTSYKNVVYLCGDAFSTGVGGIGNPGFACSKSLNGGVLWLGTTLDAPLSSAPAPLGKKRQGFYSGLGKDHSIDPKNPAYIKCGGATSSAGAGVQPLPNGHLIVLVTCNNNTYLSQSKDEGATWKIIGDKLPAGGGSLRIDSAGNLYLLQKIADATNGDKLLLSHLKAGASTWSTPLNMIAPGVKTVGTSFFVQGTHAKGQIAHIAVAYYGSKKGQTTSDGYLTATTNALATNPLFWSGQVNNPKHPLLYNTTTSGNIGITVLDFNGGAWAPNGKTVWGSWVQDCGANFLTDPNCTKRYPSTNPGNPDDGFAGRLVWQTSS